MLVARPSSLPTPCSRCPKGGPENEKMYQITPKNKRFLDLYRRSKDEYFEMPEHLKGCKLRQELFYAVDQVEESRNTIKLANKMAEEKRKRDRAAARQKVKESEPLVYARMQAEQKARENKKSGWKIFGDDD